MSKPSKAAIRGLCRAYGPPKYSPMPSGYGPTYDSNESRWISTDWSNCKSHTSRLSRSPSARGRRCFHIPFLRSYTMKSRMKCFSFLALIAFGFGYSDLLVRPCWAHVGHCHNKSHEPPSPTCQTPSYHIPGTIISAAVSLYEWLDGCYGDIQDYIEEKNKEQQGNPGGGGGTVSSSGQVVGSIAPPPPGTETNTNQGVSTDPNPCDPHHPDYPNCN